MHHKRNNVQYLVNIANYIRYNRHSKDLYDLDIKAIYQENPRKIYVRLKEENGQALELDYGDNPDKLKGEYLDMYEGVKSEVLHATKFDENSN